MPRGTTGTIRSSHKKTRTPKNRKKRPSGPPVGIDELMRAAESALHVQDPLQAISLCTVALLRKDVQDTVAVSLLEKRAEAKVSVADQEGARQDYTQALERLQSIWKTPDRVAAEETHITLEQLEQKASLELYIGQLSEGIDALQRYKNGIEDLRISLERRQANLSVDFGTEDETMSEDENQEEAERSTDSEITLTEIRKQLAAAYCSAAELFLTDLCFEESAEQDCESYLSQALTLLEEADGEPFVDALQTASSLRLSQQRGLEAVEYALRAFAKIKAGCQALTTLVGLREAEEPSVSAIELLELESVQRLPGFEFRCQTAKLLLECSSVLQDAGNEDTRAEICIMAAIDVLGSLLAENDEVVEIWLLVGDAFAATQPPTADAAIHHWERALAMLATVKTSIEQEAFEADDNEEDELQKQLEEVTCQMEDLGTKIEEMKAIREGNEEMET